MLTLAPLLDTQAFDFLGVINGFSESRRHTFAWLASLWAIWGLAGLFLVFFYLRSHISDTSPSGGKRLGPGSCIARQTILQSVAWTQYGAYQSHGLNIMFASSENPLSAARLPCTYYTSLKGYSMHLCNYNPNSRLWVRGLCGWDPSSRES